MINQEDETLHLSNDVNRDLPIDITLDVNNTDEIPDELYDFLLDQFVAKAKELGYDIVETPNLVLGSWTISATLEEI